MAAASRHALMFPSLNLEKPSPISQPIVGTLISKGHTCYHNTLASAVLLSSSRASLGAESPSGDYARRCGSGAWFGPGPTTLPLFIVGQDL
jgi:hypothetical protein